MSEFLKNILRTGALLLVLKSSTPVGLTESNLQGKLLRGPSPYGGTSYLGEMEIINDDAHIDVWARATVEESAPFSIETSGVIFDKTNQQLFFATGGRLKGKPYSYVGKEDRAKSKVVWWIKNP